MKLLDLFAGIGGFSLAAHWMGWETAAFCEQDKKCQERLRLRFGADIPIYDDIRTFPAKLFRSRSDIVTAGFPCQPFSNAGQRRGTADDRYLWDEVVRVVSDAKPAWVCGENVAGIATMVFERGQIEVESRRLTRTAEADDYHSVLSREEYLQLERCCADLEGEGYEVQPLVIPACAVNAPHRRDRVWILGHLADAEYEGRLNGRDSRPKRNNHDDRRAAAAKSNGRIGRLQPDARSDSADDSYTNNSPAEHEIQTGRHMSASLSDSNANGCGLERRGLPKQSKKARQAGANADTNGKGVKPHSNAGDQGLQGHEFAGTSGQRTGRPPRSITERFGNENWFEAASRLCRVDDGLSDRVDRLKQLGNSVVPVEVYEIFRAIDEVENSTVPGVSVEMPDSPQRVQFSNSVAGANPASKGPKPNDMSRLEKRERG